MHIVVSYHWFCLALLKYLDDDMRTEFKSNEMKEMYHLIILQIAAYMLVGVSMYAKGPPPDALVTHIPQSHGH